MPLIYLFCPLTFSYQDLISYEIEKLNPLKIKECAIGSGQYIPAWRAVKANSDLVHLKGGLCGSVFLDVAFAKYIETVIGEKQYNSIKESYRNKMMKEFEFGIKRAFNGHDDQTYSVDLKGVKDDPKNGIVDETITIKLCAALFS